MKRTRSTIVRVLTAFLPTLLAIAQDDMYDVATVDATHSSYIKGLTTNLIWYDQGHTLTEACIPDALTWLEQHLK